jgi:hypothetical protein
MGRWGLLAWIVLAGCGGVTVGPDSASGDSGAGVDTAVAVDALPGGDTGGALLDRPRPTDGAPPIVDTGPPSPDATALAYCRASCATVVRCDPGQVQASCELSCARRWGNMRLRPEVWQRGVACVPGLPCGEVGTGDADRLFERCILPSTSGVLTVAGRRLCEGIDAFHRQLGRTCRNLPAGAECQLAATLFTDAALEAASAACFGPMATCDQARACFADRLGLSPGSV